MRPDDQRDPEAGVTFIELVITIAIMGIAFVALLSALGTAIIISDVHKRQSTAETVLGGWAETLKSAAYAPCPTTEYDYATVMGGGPPQGYTPSLHVQWWNGTSHDPSVYVDASPAWPPACATDNGLEQVTLTITARHGVTEDHVDPEADDVMRRVRGQHGVTLIELLIAVTILGVIAVPLSASLIVGLKTTDKAQATLADGTATDLLNMYLAPDVQNSDPGGPVSLAAQDCRGAGSSAPIVFHHLDGNDVSYAVETIGGQPALTWRDEGISCVRQVIAPGLATGFQLGGGTPTPAGAPIAGTLHLYCGNVSTECPSGNYANLKMVKIALTTPTGYTVQLRGTTRT